MLGERGDLQAFAMPPVLRLRPFVSQGSQVEAPQPAPQFSRPACRGAASILKLDPAKLRPDRPEGFTYHNGTSAVVTETPDFVEVSDGPAGGGFSTGERRAHDGSWSEQFVQQRGGPVGKGAGKASASAGARDVGRRIGRNTVVKQRWKESWERTEAGQASGVYTKVERHVQEVEDVEAESTTVLQEWDEDEESFEAPAENAGLQGSSSSGAASSSSAPASASPSTEGCSVLRSVRRQQRGTDKQTGRVWTRTVTRRWVRQEDAEEVVTESEEENQETEANGEERGSSRRRVGRSVMTSEWGSQPSGNRWRSKYSLQTLVNRAGEICGREWVQKWYDNGEEEQTEEWETLDEFGEAKGSHEAATSSTAPAAARAIAMAVQAPTLRLRRRIKSGKKDGRKHGGKCEEWHERWEEQEVPIEEATGQQSLKLERKTVEKWWRENACNNAWGEHRIEHVGHTVEQRKWYDNGQERQNESWVERPDGSAEGSKEGHRGGQSWGESWRRSCDGEDGAITVEKWHDDGLGTKVESTEGRRWKNSKDVEWHREEIGEVVGQASQWVVKVGGNAIGDEWFERWSERQAEKSAEKRGKNAQGDDWRETWVEEYDAEGIRVRQQAEKEGSNAQGDKWYETWIEEQEHKKRALKKGQSGSGAQWQEEWGEEVGQDGAGTKWTSKWASDAAGHQWGENFGDEWGTGGADGKRWVELWDNQGKNEKHSHPA